MIYLIYGVTASGKTSVGKSLSKKLKVPFYDADDFHPSSNIEKMKSGIPLNDSDRKPWLKTLRKNIESWQKNGSAILACSALKESYRSILMGDMKIPMQFILLQSPISTLKKRLETRKGHFISPTLLDSQIKTLEVPDYGIRFDSNIELKKLVKQIVEKVTKTSDLGIIGMGTMGKNLSLNISEKRFSISIYNREIKGREESIAAEFAKENKKFNLMPFNTLPKFISSLKVPRKIFLTINSGDPTDEILTQLMMILDPGDVIVDLGNSYFIDSRRRSKFLAQKKIHFLGIGISGGHYGARNGASFMASGDKYVYKMISPIIEKISALDNNGKPCSSFLGSDGVGHYVKTVHNGIEYGEMQLIAEIYHLMRFHLKMNIDKISNIFKKWNKSDLSSYLLEVTSKILDTKVNGAHIIDLIDDKAENKGTGAWGLINSVEIGVPFDTLSSSLMFRYISSMSDERKIASNAYQINLKKGVIDEKIIEKAYSAARIINHSLGFNLLQKASVKYKWNLNLSEIARIWTNGCIIRSKLMNDWIEILSNKSFEHPLLHVNLVKELKKLQPSLSELLSVAIKLNCSLPVHSSSLNFFLSFTNKSLPSVIIQSQRDFFGMHGLNFKNESEMNNFNHQW